MKKLLGILVLGLLVSCSPPAQKIIPKEGIFTESNKEYLISFKVPQLAITPGQSVVFYDKDTLLGGGVIE